MLVENVPFWKQVWDGAMRDKSYNQICVLVVILFVFNKKHLLGWKESLFCKSSIKL